MNKSIEFTQSQIEAFKNGASMLLFQTKTTIEEEKMLNFFIYKNRKIDVDSFIKKYSPIQKGDKDIFIKEEFRLYTETQIDYKADTPNINLEWKSASQMTKKESRYTISECIGASAVRVQDIPLNGIKKIIGENSFVICDEFEQFRFDLKKLKELYNNQLKESNINRTYEDNDYVFLLEVKR